MAKKTTRKKRGRAKKTSKQLPKPGVKAEKAPTKKKSSRPTVATSVQASSSSPGSLADFNSFFPSRALEIGRMYKLAADEKEDTLIREHARRVIDEFCDLVDSFPKGTREHAYMVNFHHSALDYSGNIRRLDQELDDEQHSARESRDHDERGVLETVKHGTMLKVGFHYLMIGGLFFFLATSIPKAAQVEGQTSTLARYSRELAAGIGSMVLAYIAQGLILSHRLGKVRRAFDLRVWQARRDWAHAHVEVHNLALTTVEHEWKQITGRDAPLGDLCRLQIRAVYLGALSARAPRQGGIRRRLAQQLRRAGIWRAPEVKPEAEATNVIANQSP